VYAVLVDDTEVSSQPGSGEQRPVPGRSPAAGPGTNVALPAVRAVAII
jgi:hypothetical protein